jgi:serine protease Do
VRGFLGAFTDPVTPQIARVYGVPVSRGAIVSNLSATVEVDGSLVESPAAKAGIKPNDVIVEFQGYKIKDNSDLVRRVASTPVGTAANVKLYRDGRETTLSVVIARRPGREVAKRPDTSAISNAEESSRTQSIGIGIQSLTIQASRGKELGGTAGATRGVQVLRVEPGSIADDAELKPNDVIEMINREAIRDKEDFKRVLSQLKPGDSVVLQVYREKLTPFPRIFISFNKP